MCGENGVGLTNDPVDWHTLFYKTYHASLDLDFHRFMIKPELTQNRRVKVAVVVRVLDRFVTDFIRRAVNYSTLDPATGEPRSVPFGIMIPTGCVL